jgi:hypothetical protein
MSWTELQVGGQLKIYIMILQVEHKIFELQAETARIGQETFAQLFQSNADIRFIIILYRITFVRIQIILILFFFFRLYFPAVKKLSHSDLLISK